MLRNSVSRTLLRPLTKQIPGHRLMHDASTLQPTLRLKQGNFISKQIEPLAITAYRRNTALIRGYATAVLPGTVQNPQKENEWRQEKLEPHPDLVSSGSSVHPVFGEIGVEQKEEDVDMMAGIRHDLKVIKATFALDEVPREAYNIGLAGVLPYLATSAATVYCAFEVGQAASGGGLGILMSGNTAELCLHVLEPLQVGYGAVILSFLGAIHWGLEWAGYGGKGGYRRYAIGIFAPAVAWPTVLMPVEYALITQFLSFVLLYAVDSSATIRGWTPHWYASYRFILTFIVGVSIVVSLIGRGQIWGHIDRAPVAMDRVKELREVVTPKKKSSKGKKARQEPEDEE